jgi:hypothetical protein
MRAIGFSRELPFPGHDMRVHRFTGVGTTRAAYFVVN